MNLGKIGFRLKNVFKQTMDFKGRALFYVFVFWLAVHRRAVG